MCALFQPWFELTSAESSTLAYSVVAVWAIGFGFRAIIRVLNIDETKGDL